MQCNHNTLLWESHIGHSNPTTISSTNRLTQIPFPIFFLPDCEQENVHAPCILYRNDNLEVQLTCATE